MKVAQLFRFPATGVAMAAMGLGSVALADPREVRITNLSNAVWQMKLVPGYRQTPPHPIVLTLTTSGEALESTTELLVGAADTFSIPSGRTAVFHFRQPAEGARFDSQGVEQNLLLVDRNNRDWAGIEYSVSQDDWGDPGQAKVHVRLHGRLDQGSMYSATVPRNGFYPIGQITDSTHTVLIEADHYEPRPDAPGPALPPGPNLGVAAGAAAASVPAAFPLAPPALSATAASAAAASSSASSTSQVPAAAGGFSAAEKEKLVAGMTLRAMFHGPAIQHYLEKQGYYKNTFRLYHAGAVNLGSADWGGYHRFGDHYSDIQLKAIFKAGFLWSLARQSMVFSEGFNDIYVKIYDKFFNWLEQENPIIIQLGINYQQIKILLEKKGGLNGNTEYPKEDYQAYAHISRYCDALNEYLSAALSIYIYAYAPYVNTSEDPSPILKKERFFQFLQGDLAKNGAILNRTGLEILTSYKLKPEAAAASR